jgi:hypothetical protein
LHVLGWTKEQLRNPWCTSVSDTCLLKISTLQ